MIVVDGLNGTIKDAIEELQALAATGGVGGATTFLGLTDTPTGYAGAETFFVKVNSAGTALEFAPGNATTSNVPIDCGSFTAPNENILIDCGSF